MIHTLGLNSINFVSSSCGCVGMDGGPTCECSSYYFKSEERLAELIALWKLRDTSFLDALDFDDRSKAIQMMCSRMAFDGEMASSGTVFLVL